MATDLHMFEFCLASPPRCPVRAWVRVCVCVRAHVCVCERESAGARTCAVSVTQPLNPSLNPRALNAYVWGGGSGANVPVLASGPL